MRFPAHRMAIVTLLATACSTAPFAECLSDFECGVCERCGNGACIATPGTCRAGLVASPERLLLGPTAEGSRSTSGRVVVTAAGTRVSDITVELQGAAGALVVEQDECSAQTLELGGTCSVDLALEPPSIARYEASLRIGGASVPPISVRIEGTGVASPELSMFPRRFNFGTVVVGRPVEAELLLTNHGGLSLVVTRIRLDGPDAALFTAEGCIGRLPPSTSCTLSVGFEPQVPTGQRSVTLIAEAEGGIVALAEVTGDSVAPPRITAELSRLGLPWTSIGGDPTATFAAFRNEGGRPTGLVTTEISGSERSDFAASGCSQPIDPGARCEVRVVFTPGAPGRRSAVLTLSSTSGGSASIDLLGEGLAWGSPTARPAAIDLGEVTPGSISAYVYYELEIAPGVRLGPPLLTGTHASEFVFVPNGGQQGGPPGVAFRPGSAGPKTAVVDFGFLTIPLAAIGLDPTSTRFEPSTLRRLYSGPSSELISAVLRNDASIATGTISLTPPASQEVTLRRDHCSGAALSAGGSCAIDLRIDAGAAAGERLVEIVATASPGGRVHLPISYGVWPPGGSVEVTVVGHGSVEGSGLHCPGDCRRAFVSGTTVRLNAMAEPDSEFTGWSLGCAGGGPCEITIAGGHSVEAHFTPRPRLLQVTRLGDGRVASSPLGIDCGPDCDETFIEGEQVTLTATPEGMHIFAGWSGGCAGMQPRCQVRMNGSQRVEAHFSTPNHVFVSSTTVSPSVAELPTFADTECARLAVSAGLPGVFLAWLSAEDATAASRVTARGPIPRGWVRTDGAPFANRLSDLLSGGIYFPAITTERGAVLSATTSVVTGSLPGGGRGFTCFGWRRRDSTYTAGAAGAGAFGWTSISARPCDESAHLYCLGVDRAAPLAVSRDSSRFAFISADGWSPAGGIESADRMCQGEADEAGLLGEFRAFLAAVGQAPSARVDLLGEPWARIDGIPLVTRSDKLREGLLSALDLQADGETYVGPELVWTGAAGDVESPGSPATTCSDWSSAAPEATGTTGNPMMTNETWVTTPSATPCAEPHRVYCFQR